MVKETTGIANDSAVSGSRQERLVMPDDAVALQAVRFVGENDLRYYTPITFPDNPKGGCQMYYNRCRTFGGVAKAKAEEAGICDVLNDAGDIIADFPLTQKGLNYLYRALGCRVEA